MLELGLAFFAGLLVGWNLLPQPAWAKLVWTTLVNLVNKKTES
jgi:hypothetical protein